MIRIMKQLKLLMFITLFFVTRVNVALGADSAYGYFVCKNGDVVRLKSISIDDEDKTNYAFVYDTQGNLCRIKEGDYSSFDISYNPMCVQWRYGDAEEWELYDWTISINSKGQWESIEDTGSFSGDSESYWSNWHFLFNEDNCLTNYTETNRYDVSVILELTWQDGNIINMKYGNDEMMEYYDFYYDDENVNFTRQYSYTARLIGNDESAVMFAGMLGKGCRNLPSRIVSKITEEYGPDESYEYRFKYSFNEDGTLASSSYSKNNGTFVETKYTYEKIERPTGIKYPVNDYRESNSTIIYDLLGQRHSSLIRGLNIVNTPCGKSQKIIKR